MQLRLVDVVNNVAPEDFRENYFQPNIPVVIKRPRKQWPAYRKWNWELPERVAGEKKIGYLQQYKSDAYTPINKTDDYLATFGDCRYDSKAQPHGAYSLQYFHMHRS